MSPLSHIDPETFRARLRAIESEIKGQLADTEENAAPVSLDLPIGRLTRQDAMQNQQMTLALRSRLEQQLARVAAALRRIDAGDYGICVACKQPIALRRLELMPETPLCVACQQSRK